MVICFSRQNVEIGAPELCHRRATQATAEDGKTPVDENLSANLFKNRKSQEQIGKRVEHVLRYVCSSGEGLHIKVEDFISGNLDGETILIE